MVDLHLIYLVIFSIGLSLASGASILTAVLILQSVRDKRVSKKEFELISTSRHVIWFGFIMYGFGGVGLFTLSAEAMLSLGIFYASMSIAGILLASNLFFHLRYLPRLKDKEMLALHGWHLPIIEAISVTSWLFLILHHAMFRAEVSYSAVMAVYFFTLLAFITVFFFFSHEGIEEKQKESLMKVFSILATAGFFFGILTFSSVSFLSGLNISLPSGVGDVKEKIEQENTTFTWREVGQHQNIEDCWTVIDKKVYDVTPAAEKYPDVYLCGEDSTEAYRAIKPEGVSSRVQAWEIGDLGFSAKEVSENNTKESCWLIIDGLVFDATDETELHPAAFNCGEDVTHNYFKNHGGEISERMMRSHIGSLDDGVVAAPTGNPEEKVLLEPYRELFVKEGSWDPHELMAVVEKGPEKLLFIDGQTHELIGRVHDVGFQPHTSVFSPDAKYMFIISRNGWLVKINLETLEPAGVLDVGESSRGTALTDDGKYVAVGNYEPGNVVIVDPDTMEILKKIPTVGELDGETIESRVGAMVEDGDKIIAALKDLNSVWIIDTSQDDFPVVNKYWNIGDNEMPLHDAFLSADGKHYVVASMGSHTVWVLDTDTWEPVTEVPTGETPHTGPGATWGDNVYIPALGEGLITVIDTNTWEPVKYIETAGPGLFIRSFSEDPEYPYVWAETAFGEFHDEVYVIDARVNEIVETIRPVPGESSWHPEFTNNGEFVYVVSQTADEVEVYDAYTFDLVKRIESGTPSAVSNVGNRIEEFGL